MQYIFSERFHNIDKKNKELFLADISLIHDIHDMLEKGKWVDIYDSFTSLKFSSSRITLKVADNESEGEISLQSAIIDSLRALRKEYMTIFKNIVSDMKKTGRNLSEDLFISADVLHGLYKLCVKTEEFACSTNRNEFT